MQEQAVYDTIAALVGGTEVGYSQRGSGLKPIAIKVALPRSGLTLGERVLSTPLPAGGTARQGANVELGDVVTLKREVSSYPIYRHNGRFAEMVTGELAGRFEAPVYGMLAVDDKIASMDWGESGKPQITFHGQPLDESKPTLLWDGEWEVTYVTFRDMGAAFGVAILAIYLLVVAQFGSFVLPLVVLTPVPLTLIGIVLGHWALGAPFTATSMIGFIALAGIIVRNSILLVDFIRTRRAQGIALRPALIEAGATRFKPIFLTAAAAMIGAAFILTDPIFQGLAISLVFGLASSTALDAARHPGDLRLAQGRRAAEEGERLTTMSGVTGSGPEGAPLAGWRRVSVSSGQTCNVDRRASDFDPLASDCATSDGSGGGGWAAWVRAGGGR